MKQKYSSRICARPEQLPQIGHSLVFNDQSSQLKLLAKTIVAKYSKVESDQNGHRNQKQLRGVYQSFVRLICKMFGQLFSNQISGHLLNIFHKLVFFYEAESQKIESQYKNKKMLQKIAQFGVKNKQTVELENQLNSLKNNQLTIQSLKHSKIEDSPQYRVFIIDRLKEEYKRVQATKKIVNDQIKEINLRIQTAYKDIEHKIQTVELKHIVETNKLKQTLKRRQSAASTIMTDRGVQQNGDISGG